MAVVALWQGFGFWSGGFQVRNPIPEKIHLVWGLLHVILYIVSHLLVWCGNLEREVPAPVLSLSSDSSSKFRGSSQNGFRFASKLDVRRPMSPYLKPLQQPNRLNGHVTLLPYYSTPPHVPVPEAITATEPVEWTWGATTILQYAAPCPRT
ncbi:hypothetical protein AVEN_52534-1 [Araneus ventricosus]|uniref:Uncharacterized protein n=1 Tax=Araneus ventricosus TaxID=182803 RepID=A0A4Y2HGF2_ARAVE|nr:hypothetical protein AVEN_52534-1 [Araneus ventricosus]